jgi:dTDP-4-amino-4,6-dideoxygalactose transaminase
MWSRIRLDIGLADIAAGLIRCVFAGDRRATERRVEALWAPEGDALVTFSVRSGLDLMLQALDLPKGSEVLFSALNVKGMIRIVERHGLVPVPVDLDLRHMGPAPAALERAVSPKSRALVVAHLFGTRLDLDAVVAFARRHGLVLVEDCAQAFTGLDYRGHPGTDVSLFSFGPLKTATAIGGALARVRDGGLRQRMRTIQDAYPVQTSGSYAKRLVKFAALKLILSRPVFRLVTGTLRLFADDYEDAIGDAVRGVAQLGSAKKIRKRPSAALLAVLERRLARFDPADLEQRIDAARRLDRHLAPGVVRPASANALHTYWVYPMLADDPKPMIAALRRAGFDGAQQSRSQAVAAPPDRPELTPVVAADALARLVVLPCYPAMPDAEIAREAAVVNARSIAAE